MSDLAKNDGDTGLAIASMESDVLSDMIEANLGGADLSVSDLDRITMPSGGGSSWEVPTIGGVENQSTIEGIIVDWQDTRAYWDSTFEENPGSDPACRSADAVVGIGDPGGECASCPMAEWGSADKGEGQACKLQRLLFVVSKNQILPTVIKLPPSSVGPCRTFFLRLLNEGVHFSAVMTSIGLEKTENDAGISYSVASFEASRKLDESERAAVEAYRKRIAPDLKTSADDVDDMEAA